MSPKLLAMYLPQYYPFPENDTWWGKGFTEWTNVTKARPLFDGHYQPYLPTDFGFYDLRVRQTRREQIEVAKAHGIDGFCYHYYWFSGKRLLDVPVDDMLADKESDMPFCLCWANENWTRRWDASESEILIAQEFGPDDDLNFIDDLLPFLNDPRYIRIGDAPLLIVYRPHKLPDVKKSIQIWRARCREMGIENIFLVAALTHGNESYEEAGFDAGLQFPPHNLRALNWSRNFDLSDQIGFYQEFSGTVYDLPDLAEFYLSREYEGTNVFPTVSPCWDNTARMGDRAQIFLNGTPENYEYWLRSAAEKAQRNLDNDRQFVFINAWNEWAEGCHLEPDRRYGRQFLEATRRVKDGSSQADRFVHRGYVSQTYERRPESATGELRFGRTHSRVTTSKLKKEIKRLGAQIARIFSYR